MATYREALKLVRQVDAARQALDVHALRDKEPYHRLSDYVAAFMIDGHSFDDMHATRTALESSGLTLDSPLVAFDVGTLQRVARYAIAAGRAAGADGRTLKEHGRTLRQEIPTFEAASRLGHR